MLLDVQQLAERLQVAPGTVYDWRKRGFIQAFRGGRKLLFDEADVLNAMRQRGLDGVSVNLEPGESIR
jgi:excisionase family DNA binding protein